MDMRKLLTSFILIGLFIVAMIGFGFNMAEENNAEGSILDDSSVSNIYTDVQDSISQGRSKSDESSKPLLNSSDSSFTEATADFIITGIKSVALGAFSTVDVIFRSITSPLMNMLGIPDEIKPILSAVISSIFMFTLVFLIWKLYKQGK